MRTPAALLALPLLTGSTLGLLFSGASDPFLPLCAAAASFLALIAAFGFFADDFREGVACAVPLGCLLAGTSLGISAARAAYRPALLGWFDAREAELRDAPAVLEGVLRDDAAVTPAGVSVLVAIHKPARGGVRLSIAGGAALDHVDEWRAGRAVRMPALLRRPTSYGDPGLPDETRALARRGVVLIGTVKSAALVEVVSRGGAIDQMAASARAWARRHLARYIGCWSAQSGAIAAAILIGDRSGLSDADERRLQEAGTYHVIAISGGNIAILTAILLVLLRVLQAGPNLSAALVILALVFYGQIASGGASVSRAITAACVYLAGRMLDHRGPPLNILAVAGTSALAVSPLAAFDGGFILSFGATLGILVGAPRLWSHFRTKHEHATTGMWRRLLATKAWAAVAGLFIATLCAEIALAPASAVLFSRITVAGLLLNFAAIPLMTVVQAAAMATLAAAPMSDRLASGCGYVAHIASTGLVRSAGFVEIAPWLSRDVVPPAWWLVSLYYASCVVLLTWKRRARVAVAAVTCAGLLMFASPRIVTQAGIAPPVAGMLRVVFLDVGQGDATFVRLPDGHTLLVDAGGLPGSTFDMGERVLAPALRALGVRRIDTLVLTHGDPDHVGGAPAIVRGFRPGAVWEGVPVPPHPALREIAALAATSGMSWRTVVAGDRERAGGVEIRVLHPPLPDWERQRVRNDDSIVLELRMEDVSIVLPGDIAKEGERAVTPLLATAPITILKAPHHGSATSSSLPFLEAAHPSAVIFSEGRGNRFGHPAPVVVQRYRDRHALIFRTDQDGAIVVDTDGHRVSFNTWSGRKVGVPFP